MLDGRQDYFGGEWKAGNDGPGRQSAVVGTVGRPTREIVKKLPFHAFDLLGNKAGAVRGRNTPAEFPVLFKVHRVLHRILLLDQRGAPAVFKIIAIMRAHERIADA